MTETEGETEREREILPMTGPGWAEARSPLHSGLLHGLQGLGRLGRHPLPSPAILAMSRVRRGTVGTRTATSV